MNIDGFEYAASSGGDVPPRDIIPALAKLRSMEGEGISPRSNPIDLNRPTKSCKNEIKKKALFMKSFNTCQDSDCEVEGCFDVVHFEMSNTTSTSASSTITASGVHQSGTSSTALRVHQGAQGNKDNTSNDLHGMVSRMHGTGGQPGKAFGGTGNNPFNGQQPAIIEMCWNSITPEETFKMVKDKITCDTGTTFVTPCSRNKHAQLPKKE